MSSGLAGIDCRTVDPGDYPSTFLLTPKEVVKVIKWLAKL
jgi:hypothetical protein